MFCFLEWFRASQPVASSCTSSSAAISYSRITELDSSGWRYRGTGRPMLLPPELTGMRECSQCNKAYTRTNTRAYTGTHTRAHVSNLEGRAGLCCCHQSSLECVSVLNRVKQTPVHTHAQIQPHPSQMPMLLPPELTGMLE